MAGWGMGHNLEKNLQRVQSFREKGQLDRALRQLQEWARKYPDTPHYLYEAAMVAFDLEDWTTGLNSLRSLLRSLPDTREKVLVACRERFDDAPALPLAEFLVDSALNDGAMDSALDLVSTLPENDLGIYRRKASMRHQSLVATQSTPVGALQSSHGLQLVLACAAGDGPTALDATEALLELDAAWRDRIAPLLASALDRHGDGAGWMLARATVRLAEGVAGEAASLAAQAVRREPSMLARASRLLDAVQPQGEERGAWSCARGDLAVLARDGRTAAAHYTDAADAAPRSRDDLIARIAQACTDPELEGRADLMKLHLRLLVVQKRFDEIPTLAQVLLSQGLAQAQELRTLLGEGRAGALPSDMLAVLAETALRDGDLAAAATHAYEIPSHEDAALQRLLRAIESLVDEWPADTRVQLDALRAVLLARTRNREATNACLATMWQMHADQAATVLAVTEKCVDHVEPLPSLLRAAIGPALDADLGEAFRPLLKRLLQRDESDDPSSPLDAGLSFNQEELSLDFGGGSTDDHGDEVGLALLGALDDDPARGERMLALLDSLDRSYGVQHRQRHAVAVAALHAGDHRRALPELAVLVMMAERGLIEQVASQIDVAIERQGELPDLLLARADLHSELDAIEAAADCLSRALAVDPSRAEDLTQRFERLLARVDQEDAPMLWRAFGEALFEAGRFDQLAEVCRRALETLAPDRTGPFLVLQARMLIEEGRLSQALQAIQQHVVAGRLSPELAIDLLEDVIAAQPASPIAHLMLGQAATRAERIERAIEAYTSSVRLDPSLAGPVSEQLQKILARAGTIGAHVMRVASFYRETGDPSRAAAALDKAIRLDESLADRVLGELGTELDAAEVHLDLAQVGARAARHAGQVERACELLLRLDQRDPARFEVVLSELRQLREAHPEHLLPALCVARVLLQHDAPEAAAQTVAEAGEQASYPLAERVEMLLEFHRRDPRDAGLTLSLAARLGEQGAIDAAVERMRAAMDLDGFTPEKAIEVVRTLLEPREDHPHLRLLLHDLLARVGRIDEAMRALPDPAALGEWQQTEISERLAEHPARVQASSELSLLLARSLRMQGRTEDAIAVLERASERLQARMEHPLWTELARLLFEAGHTGRSRKILLAQASDPQARREAHRQFAAWNEERVEGELRALRERHQARPQAAHIALQLAEKLLEAGRPDEVPTVLANQAPSAEWKVRRAVLLGRAYLDTHRADRARAVLLDASAHASDDAPSRELRYRLAECEHRLNRPAAAAAQLETLLDDAEFRARATELSRRSYQNYLEDVSGSYRAVLTRVSTL